MTQTKLIISVLALVALIALAYFFLRERPTFVATTPDTATSSAPAAVTDKVIAEETPKYIVNITYPHFGVSAIDGVLDARIEGTVSEFKKEANADDSGQSAKYELDGTYDSLYASPDIMSARLIISTYTGGAHPNSVVSGLNFDSRTGRALTLDDARSLTKLSLQEIATSAKTQLQAALAASDGTLQFPEGADATAENYAAFTIGKSAVTFYFQPYQVAAYSAGILTATFPRK